MKIAFSFLFQFSIAKEHSGYTLMRENVPYFCYDDFLMQTSEQRSRAGCLEFCALVYDPGCFLHIFLMLTFVFCFFRG